jgi:hypothetical protein
MTYEDWEFGPTRASTFHQYSVNHPQQSQYQMSQMSQMSHDEQVNLIKSQQHLSLQGTLDVSNSGKVFVKTDNPYSYSHSSDHNANIDIGMEYNNDDSGSGYTPNYAHTLSNSNYGSDSDRNYSASAVPDSCSSASFYLNNNNINNSHIQNVKQPFIRHQSMPLLNSNSNISNSSNNNNIHGHTDSVHTPLSTATAVNDFNMSPSSAPAHHQLQESYFHSDSQLNEWAKAAKPVSQHNPSFNNNGGDGNIYSNNSNKGFTMTAQDTIRCVKMKRKDLDPEEYQVRYLDFLCNNVS